MRFVIQRVKNANVVVEGNVIGEIGRGFLILIGISDRDDQKIADKMIQKALGLRIFEDEAGKTNLDLNTVGGSVLLISQFTLYADCRKGNRPSFTEAGKPDHANELYEYIIRRCKETLGAERVQTGVFGADMKVSLLNDGPFTVILDSSDICPNVAG